MSGQPTTSSHRYRLRGNELEALKMRRAGASLQVIAERFGVTDAAISHCLSRPRTLARIEYLRKCAEGQRRKAKPYLMRAVEFEQRAAALADLYGAGLPPPYHRPEPSK